MYTRDKGEDSQKKLRLHKRLRNRDDVLSVKSRVEQSAHCRAYIFSVVKNVPIGAINKIINVQRNNKAFSV